MHSYLFFQVVFAAMTSYYLLVICSPRSSTIIAKVSYGASYGPISALVPCMSSIINGRHALRPSAGQLLRNLIEMSC